MSFLTQSHQVFFGRPLFQTDVIVYVRLNLGVLLLFSVYACYVMAFNT